MIRASLTTTLLVVAACGGAPVNRDASDVGSASSNDGVVTDYDATYAFTSPSCTLYMVDRVIDVPDYVGEYDARETEDGVQVAATYVLSPDEALPLHLDLSVDSSEPFLAIALDQNEVTFSDSAKHVLLDVVGYGSDAPVVTTSPGSASAPFPAPASVATALRIARCNLPGQSVLGAIPGFFDNRSDSSAAGGDVTGHDVDAPSVVTTWSGPLTILQAYERVVACLTATNGASPLAWSCPS